MSSSTATLLLAKYLTGISKQIMLKLVIANMVARVTLAVFLLTETVAP